jgi:DNA mismatch repair protein MutS2
MVQCGLPVPVAEGSVFGIFESILLDIGDDQSIENDLSTYSSHLHAMKCFLENANEQTLFLVDELGSGTEPRIGGALAQSMLMQLNDQEAMGLVTTHYANLKLLASSTPGIFNGAMRFDNKKMLPLFILDTGNPGSSFAIEIARRTGIDEKILEDAQNLAGSEFFRYDSRLQDLESDQIRLEKKVEDLEKKEDFLNNLIREYESMKSLNDRVKKDMEAKKKVLLNHAKTEAAEIIEKANQLVENTIKEIRESKADKIITKESREKLEVFVKQNKPQPPVESIFVAIPEPEPAETISGQINIGDSVWIKGLFDVGEVIDIKGKKITVAFDSVKTIIQVDNLEKVKKQKTIPKKKSYVTPSLASGIQEKKAYFNPQADMRGIRAEEAYTYIQNYIDDALMLGITELSILHGKGNGVLRNIVREYLRTLSQVEWYGDENPDRGGAGITLVRLK